MLDDRSCVRKPSPSGRGVLLPQSVITQRPACFMHAYMEGPRCGHAADAEASVLANDDAANLQLHIAEVDYRWHRIHNMHQVVRLPNFA